MSLTQIAEQVATRRKLSVFAARMSVNQLLATRKDLFKRVYRGVYDLVDRT